MEPSPWRSCRTYSVCPQHPLGALSSCKKSEPKQGGCPCTGTSASGRKCSPHLPHLASSVALS